MSNLSSELTGPVLLALATAVEGPPGQHALPGGSPYELKCDGFLHCTRQVVNAFDNAALAAMSRLATVMRLRSRG